MTEERSSELESMSVDAHSAASLRDEDIDFSDIPPLDEEFFKNAKLVKRGLNTEQISMAIDIEVLEWFKSHAQENEYQTLSNDVFRTYVRQQL